MNGFQLNTGSRPDLPQGTEFEFRAKDGLTYSCVANTGLLWELHNDGCDAVEWRALMVPAVMSTSEVF